MSSTLPVPAVGRRESAPHQQAEQLLHRDGRLSRACSGEAVWLAVTSVSFRYPVLELLWTLARGFQAVVPAGAEKRSAEK